MISLDFIFAEEEKGFFAHEPIRETLFHCCILIVERNAVYKTTSQQLDYVVLKYRIVSLLSILQLMHLVDFDLIK